MNSKNILLTGSSGKLGDFIKSSNLFSNIFAPTRAKMDITDSSSLESFFSANHIDIVIHCAALARVAECQKNPELAVLINTTGTSNLVQSVIQAEKFFQREIRFVYISTDGVYESTVGNYSENSKPNPYNIYGQTKLGGESAVNVLNNHCIVRTRFFDPDDIPYEYSATDIITSSLPVKKLVKILYKIVFMNFIGIVNVGGETMSDYERYKKYKPSIKPCKKMDLQSNLGFKKATNSSLDLSLLNKLINN